MPVVVFGGLLPDCFDAFLASCGAAGVDPVQDLGDVAGQGPPISDFQAVEAALGDFLFFFDFFTPVAEGLVGYSDDGGEILPGCAGVGGFADGYRVDILHVCGLTGYGGGLAPAFSGTVRAAVQMPGSIYRSAPGSQPVGTGWLMLA